MSISKSLFEWKPSFLAGVAAIICCLEPRGIYPHGISEAEADATALQSDWLEIGKDMTEAILAYEQEAGEVAQ
jgi:hypothetical protein